MRSSVRADARGGHLVDLSHASALRRRRQQYSSLAADSSILGVPVWLTEEQALLDAIADAVLTRRPAVFTGLYAAMFRQMDRDPDLRRYVERSVTYPDGYGVVRELGLRGVLGVPRLATTDVVHPIVGLAVDQKWRVGFYGGVPGVAERAAAALRKTAPGFEVVWVRDGFSPQPSIAELREARLDLVFVGLGAPRQDQWAHETAISAGVPAVLTCGGLFDFLCGDRRRAPKWMQQWGLEWSFRLALEPRRLARRYLDGNLYFLRRCRGERTAAARGRLANWPEPALGGRMTLEPRAAETQAN
jgi:N-acetylglucosaminyldiphosphoundecaprenol N-acetyl-beta-D-mannosaminyltransferase